MSSVGLSELVLIVEDVPASTRFYEEVVGLTLENVTPQVARRLRLPSGQSGAVVTDVDPDGPSAAALRAGDVILSVNSKTVSSATEAARELQKVQSGHIAQLRVWRGDGQVFVAQQFA